MTSGKNNTCIYNLRKFDSVSFTVSYLDEGVLWGGGGVNILY